MAKMSNRFNSKSNFLLLGFCLLGLSCVSCLGAFAQGDDDGSSKTTREPLKGEIEEMGVAPGRAKPIAPGVPFAIPVVPKLVPKLKDENPTAGDSDKDNTMQGKVQDNTLKGQEDAGDGGGGGDLTPMTGMGAPNDGTLKGTAREDADPLVGEDPDSQDQELQVEWDRWRNRFLNAILAGTMENLNNPDASEYRWDPVTKRVMSQYPLGTISWFACNVTSDRRISGLKLIKSSGYPNYDNAVLNAVRSLEGTTLLKFPSRSRRTMVSQAGGVKTSDQFQQQYFKFGDVEHVRVPSY